MTKNISIQALKEQGQEALDEALASASENGRTETVRVLLNAGADVRAEDDWALRHASQEGHADVLDLLIAAGAPEDHPCIAEAAEHQSAIKAWIEHRQLVETINQGASGDKESTVIRARTIRL